ncbi:MAG: hypothetical protein IPJ94_22975 [Chloroflexi bacterium]|nr:hypothetical protein [Chloroflexota bacterium]
MDLEAVVSRRFSGQVALSTFPEGTDAAGVPGIQLGIEESEDGQNWQIAACGQTPDAQAGFLLDELGNFDLTCESGNEQAYYQLRPSLPTMYHASTLVESVPAEWIVDETVWRTNQPLAGGEFAELSLVYQLQSITLLVTDPNLVIDPNPASWKRDVYANADAEGGEYEAYVTTITNANAKDLKATWTLFLPTGDYYLEIWTPPGMNAPVKYEVQIAEGGWGDAVYLDGNYSYISRQERRREFGGILMRPAKPVFPSPIFPFILWGKKLSF